MVSDGRIACCDSTYGITTAPCLPGDGRAHRTEMYLLAVGEMGFVANSSVKLWNKYLNGIRAINCIYIVMVIRTPEKMQA